MDVYVVLSRQGRFEVHGPLGIEAVYGDEERASRRCGRLNVQAANSKKGKK